MRSIKRGSESALSDDERNLLTARIAALLEENNQLLRELALARAERDALERVLNTLERNQTRKRKRLYAQELDAQFV